MAEITGGRCSVIFVAEDVPGAEIFQTNHVYNIRLRIPNKFQPRAHGLELVFRKNGLWTHAGWVQRRSAELRPLLFRLREEYKTPILWLNVLPDIKRRHAELNAVYDADTTLSRNMEHILLGGQLECRVLETKGYWKEFTEFYKQRRFTPGTIQWWDAYKCQDDGHLTEPARSPVVKVELPSEIEGSEAGDMEESQVSHTRNVFLEGSTTESGISSEETDDEL
ncbi:hypothetical protein NHQ30_011360 [Ciborinia camelliae]|nr:hypothetical protein NHQ30_011360 [Ciborinia camelliae]